MNRLIIHTIHNYQFVISLILINIFATISINAQKTIAEGFYDEAFSSSFTLPIGIRFDSKGNSFVWEKSGKLYLLNSSEKEKNLILDISEEVGSWGDHGFTGFALDPNFSINGYIYAAYTVDRYYLLNYDKPDYDKDSTILFNATIGRVSRFTLDISANPYQLVEQSKKILLGETIKDGFPILADFHGVGSLAFGSDGSLFVGCGDGGLDNEPNVTYHVNQAIADGIIDSSMLIGSYRAQSLRSLNGKMLRIDKETGEGIPSNPYYDFSNPKSSASRIWALGLRNPYKFQRIPNTGSHKLEDGDPGIIVFGDVGSSYWEEFNFISSPGQNFGWPIYEGNDQVWPYGWYEIENILAPNPLSDCQRQNFIFQDLITQDNQDRKYIFLNPCSNDSIEIPVEINTYVQTRPFLYYNNITWNQPTRTFIPGYNQNGHASQISIDSSNYNIGKIFEGYSALPGSWYEAGLFPTKYNHSLLVCDFSGWIKALNFDDDMKLIGVQDIRTDIQGIVDLTYNPIDNCIYYINILYGEVRKICFGGNPPPVAIASADTLYGGNELLVNFDASASYDPNQLPIYYSWDFGDGEKSEKVKPTHRYKVNGNNAKKFIAKLIVTDSLGIHSADSLNISLNNSPPNVKIASPIDGSKYATNGYNRIDLEAIVNDAEEENNLLRYEWQIHLHHNQHFHSEEPVFTQKFSSIIDPVGCSDRDIFWYRISLKVDDSFGLSNRDEVTIYPNCESHGEIAWKRFETLKSGIIVNWENINIDKLEGFTVQKINESGTISDIGTVAATTNSNYHFLDENPIIGVNRYRIKIFIDQKTYFYSSENKIMFPISSPLQLFPNPVFSQELNIKLDQPLEEDINIEVFNLQGIKVYENLVQNTEWETYKGAIHFENLIPGLYIVVVKNGGRVWYNKIEILKSN